MSERSGSDIERLWVSMTSSSIDFKSIKKFIIKFQTRCMSDPPLSDIDFLNKTVWVWTTLNFFDFFPKIDEPGLESFCELFLVVWFDFSRSSEFELGKLDRPARRLFSSSLKFSTGFNLSDLSFWICCDKDTALFSLLFYGF